MVFFLSAPIILLSVPSPLPLLSFLLCLPPYPFSQHPFIFWLEYFVPWLVLSCLFIRFLSFAPLTSSYLDMASHLLPSFHISYYIFTLFSYSYLASLTRPTLKLITSCLSSLLVSTFMLAIFSPISISRLHPPFSFLASAQFSKYNLYHDWVLASEATCWLAETVLTSRVDGAGGLRCRWWQLR